MRPQIVESIKDVEDNTAFWSTQSSEFHQHVRPFIEKSSSTDTVVVSSPEVFKAAITSLEQLRRLPPDSTWRVVVAADLGPGTLDEMFKAAYRVLKPGGFATFIFPNTRKAHSHSIKEGVRVARYGRSGKAFPSYYWKESQIEGALIRSGFSSINKSSLGLFVGYLLKKPVY